MACGCAREPGRSGMNSPILLIETPPEDLVVDGGLFRGLQLWVNLPAAKKWVEPRYQNLGPDTVQLLTSADATSLVRLIAGELGRHVGPGSTQTPITVAHATVAPDSRLHLPWATGVQRVGLPALRGGFGRARTGTHRRGPARGLRSGRLDDLHRRGRCRALPDVSAGRASNRPDPASAQGVLSAPSRSCRACRRAVW